MSFLSKKKNKNNKRHNFPKKEKNNIDTSDGNFTRNIENKNTVASEKLKQEDNSIINIDNSKIKNGNIKQNFDTKNQPNLNEEKKEDIINREELNELLENTKLSEYFELLDEIKRGGAGSVFKGKFKTIKTTKFAALKIILFKKNKDNQKEKGHSHNSQKEYIEDHSEVMIHYKLKSRFIPDVCGYYSIKDRGVCIAMEHSQYNDLSYFRKNILKKNIFSETLLCYIASQVLNAILYLHQNKIIHMDIKIGNILIDDYLNVKLADFSISYSYKSCKKYIQLENNGTKFFKSPEVLQSKKIDVKDASKIDIFSFGVVLYKLGLMGFPYDIKDPKVVNDEEILKNIKENELTFPKTKNSEMFKSFLKKCLEKDIKNRYNIYEALNHPWIRGNKFILNEKEKLCNASKFLINIAVGNIIDFNNYINGANISG